MTDLDHLLSRLERGVLPPEEVDSLAWWVRDIAAERERYGRAVEQATALASELDAPGSIDRRRVAWALRHAVGTGAGAWSLADVLAAVAPSAPLGGPVAASGPLAGPERHPGGPTGRQAGAEDRALTAATFHPVPDTPSTATSGPQSDVRGADGDRQAEGTERAAGGRTADPEVRRLRRDLRQALESAVVAASGCTPQSGITRVAPSLTPALVATVSGRQRARARKWPWAWWCTRCDEVGAERTQSAADAAADAHAAAHAEEAAR
ncbi:hypothetical protein [Streptomyces xiamenensis]|uniref:hypothetical protein n=1 Tax=Streptomyces xiamenensis TaxID=408015 RepID=UPI0037D79CB8